MANQARIHMDLRYSIAYQLDGGTMPGSYPESYSYGIYTELPVPTKEGKYFEGWYTDSACTVPLGAVLASTSGDLTLYASWTDLRIGHGFSMDITTSNFFSSQKTGSISWEYQSIDSDGNYYVLVNRTIGDNKTTFGYWTDEATDDSFTYIGNSTVSWNGKDYVCEVWQNSQGEKQWVYRSFYAMMITTSSLGSTETYSITDMYTFDPDGKAKLIIVADPDLEVTGDTDASIGESMTLTASGETFYGWYLDGELYSSEKTVTFDRATPGLRYEARSSADVMTLSSNTVDASALGLTGPVTVSYENGSSVTYSANSFELEEPGYVVLTDSGSPVATQIRAFVDLEKTFSTTWVYDDRTYEYSIDMKYSDVYAYSLMEGSEDRSTHTSAEYVNKYFTTDDKYVQEIAAYLDGCRADSNMTDTEFASFVMRFVQSIPYLEDSKTRGALEFWKFPAEYLWDGGGDCEDSSIMYATLMYVLGYDSGILVFHDHAMGMVYLGEDTSGYTNVLEIDGKGYVFVETTDAYITETDPDGYQLGDSYGSAYSPDTVRYYYLVADSQ